MAKCVAKNIKVESVWKEWQLDYGQNNNLLSFYIFSCNQNINLNLHHCVIITDNISSLIYIPFKCFSLYFIEKKMLKYVSFPNWFFLPSSEPLFTSLTEIEINSKFHFSANCVTKTHVIFRPFIPTSTTTKSIHWWWVKEPGWFTCTSEFKRHCFSNTTALHLSANRSVSSLSLFPLSFLKHLFSSLD